MHIKLEDGHYTLCHKHRKNHELMRGITCKHQDIHMYQRREDGTYIAYDGKKEYFIEFYTIRDVNNKDKFNSTMQYVKAKSLKEPLKDQWKDFIIKVSQAKEDSNGFINLYKTSGSIRKCVQRLLFLKTYSVIDPEPIDEIEEYWLRQATQGGLMYHIKDKELDHAYYYDINSAYPAHMNNTHIAFPMTQPTFEKVDETPTIFMYGIYRAIVSESDDYNVNKLFRFNKSNYYTHFDLTAAQNIGLKIELIQDNECNYMCYKKRITGSRIFKSLIHELYEMKKKDIPLAKDLLSCLWGTLCRQNYIKKRCTLVKKAEQNGAVGFFNVFFRKSGAIRSNTEQRDKKMRFFGGLSENSILLRIAPHKW